MSLLKTLPQPVLEKALWWEGHIQEVLHGLLPAVPQDTELKPQYAPVRSLTARERAKAAELTATGHKVSASTVGNYRRRYETGGVLGLADPVAFAVHALPVAGQTDRGHSYHWLRQDPQVPGARGNGSVWGSSSSLRAR